MQKLQPITKEQKLLYCILNTLYRQSTVALIRNHSYNHLLKSPVSTRRQIMLAKQCPQCHQKINLAELKRSGSDKAYIKRKPFACPHCESLIQLPLKAEKVLSIGLLFSVILAPLSYYWLGLQTPSSIIFILGALLIVIGISTNQLINAKEQITDQATEKSMNEKSDNE